MYIKDLKEGQHIEGIYLCKNKTVSIAKNGNEYYSFKLQDKTGIIDAKIWDVNNIDEFNNLDFVYIIGDVKSFNGTNQINVQNIRIANSEEYDESEYFPTTDKDIDVMFDELLKHIDSVKNEYLNKLLHSFFDNEKFITLFKKSSAAKTVHHAFIGGLLEHTLSVTQICNFISKKYSIINRDLLITSAILHDIGKVKELSTFPENDYTDLGNLLGHIYLGTEMIGLKAKNIENFPKPLLVELQHCILAHHGELEFGSPKKPSLIEATALTFADDLDAKMEIFIEKFSNVDNFDFLGYDKFLGSNIRRTYEI